MSRQLAQAPTQRLKHSHRDGTSVKRKGDESLDDVIRSKPSVSVVFCDRITPYERRTA